MANFFICYDSERTNVVKNLANNIEALGHEVAFDSLVIGHSGLLLTLERIRKSDIFAFVLDWCTLDNGACKQKYLYAADLDKWIWPVLVSDDISTKMLPPANSMVQDLDYRNQDRDAYLSLAKALRNLPTPNPLPHPLPPLPSAPKKPEGSIPLY